MKFLCLLSWMSILPANNTLSRVVQREMLQKFQRLWSASAMLKKCPTLLDVSLLRYAGRIYLPYTALHSTPLQRCLIAVRIRLQLP